MKYEELIKLKLEEIEEKENVKILHAVESGSRAWGFASTDSDYDVRFIYVRPMEYYLALQDKKDFIDWVLNETLDINGWDLSKALRHFQKSNATLFEWSGSPIVYKTTGEWDKIKETAKEYFSCKAGMYHYYGTANKNYNAYLLGKEVKYKKYFYVLRPILACRWIEERECPPPVLFSELFDTVLEERMKEPVRKLLDIKMNLPESGKGQRIDDLNGYITESLKSLKEKTDRMIDDRNGNWEKLNQLFLDILKSK